MTLISTHHAPARELDGWRRTASTVVTVAFAALMTVSGVLYLVAPEPLRLALLRLGYPGYFLRILGTAKLLGVVGLLVPRRPVLREWAYAGFTFDLLGAIASHLSTGTASSGGPAVFALVLLATSYRLRHGAGIRPRVLSAGDA